MVAENLIRRDSDSDYIIAWKLKYDFETGKMKDETMTYGEARKKCEELNAGNPEKTFWPEKVKPAPEWHILYEQGFTYNAQYSTKGKADLFPIRQIQFQHNEVYRVDDLAYPAKTQIDQESHDTLPSDQDMEFLDL